MDDGKLILKDFSFLLQLEKKQRDAVFQDPVKFIRLRRSGKASTQRAAGELFVFGLRQSLRIWSKYWGKDFGFSLYLLNRQPAH